MNKKLYKLMNWPKIEGITYIEESNPYDILGCKASGNSLLYQFFYPGASKVNLIINNGKDEIVNKMELADDMGFFAFLSSDKKTVSYEYEVFVKDSSFRIKDAYSFSSYFLDKKTIKKYNSGTLYDAYKVMGAHLCEVSGVKGARFTVWAPNAKRISVVGSFNAYNNGVHQMQKNDEAGLFELFIPGAKENDLYYYEILTATHEIATKIDPYSFALKNVDGRDYSVIIKDDYSENNKSLKAAKKIDSKSLSIVEININDFAKSKKGDALTYLELSDLILEHVNKYGYNCVELLPVMDYKNEDSMGYHTFSYYSMLSKYGTIEEFKSMINKLHDNNIRVIMDVTYAYFDKDENGLSRFDGTCLYEHLDPKKGVHPIWGTFMFNYARPEVTSYLISNAMYLVNELKIDGLCVDSLSSILYLDYERNEGEWIANQYGGNENLDGIEFIKHLNSIVKKNNSNTITIAREKAAFPMITESLDKDGLGFDYKFNNGFMDDLNSYLSTDPLFRKGRHNELTFSMIYQYSENYINGINHDYLINGYNDLISNICGDNESKEANLRLLYSYIITHPGKKILPYGLENGTALLHSKGLEKLVTDINKIYFNNQALNELDEVEGGFEWINCIDSERSTLSYLRKSKKTEETLLVIANFSGAMQQLKVGTPLAGKYKEIFNSDDKEYGGNKKSRTKTISVDEYEADGREYSLDIKIEALSLAIYKYVPFTEKEITQIKKRKEAAIAKTKAKEFHDLSEALISQRNELKKHIDECMLKLKEFDKEIKKAEDNEKIELERAKKALLESEC